MRRYENYAAALVATVLERHLPKFERLREGLLARYGSLLTEPDA